MEGKSFYNLDYIIEINQQRLDQYTTAYQKVLERLTHIILIYSAITIFLIPLIQDSALFKIRNLFFITSLVLFLVLLAISLMFTIRLIIPVEVAYLSFPRKYYEEYRSEYEITIEDKGKIRDLLKASYIKELQEALETNEKIFRNKNYFYYNALIFGLLSIVPYLICLTFHISQKDENIQKIQIVDAGNLRNFIKMDSVDKHNIDKKIGGMTTTQTTKLPGIDNSQVLDSSPNLIKENSRIISKKVGEKK